MSQTHEGAVCPICSEAVEVAAARCPRCGAELGAQSAPPLDVTQAVPSLDTTQAVLPREPQYFSDDDRMSPVYCSACRKHTPRAVLSEGICPECWEANLRRTQAMAAAAAPVMAPAPSLPAQMVVCPGCGVANPPAHRCCSNCGCLLQASAETQQQAALVYPMVLPSARRRPRPRLWLILTMWVLTLLPATRSYEPSRGVALEAISILLAIILVCGRSLVDKLNGWLRLALAVVSFGLGVAGMLLGLASGRIGLEPHADYPRNEVRHDVLDARGD